MGILKNLLVTGAARFVNTIRGSITHAQNGMYYGTCSTAAGTAAKVVELVDPTGFELKPGVMIAVKFTDSNTASNVTLNVEGTGAKQIWYDNAVITGTNTAATGYANRYIYYVYDGTYWVFINQSQNAWNNSAYYSSAQCETAAGTAAKAASCTNYALTANTYLHFNIQHANTASSALTMNVNGTGAKSIYINGSASSSSNYTLPAGSYIAFYNGTNWYFNTNGSLPGTLAVANGGTGATTAAAARTNLGIGTVGTLSYGTSTSTFLRNDGTWATPPSGSGGSDGNNRRSFYGTCSTAAATKDKVVTLANDDGWELVPGVIVGVKFSNTNTHSSSTSSPVTLNVNGTGAKNIWYNTTHSGAGNTGTNTTIYGYANRINYYMYDGTYWTWIHVGVNTNGDHWTSAYCETAAGTAAKIAGITNYTLTANTYCHFNIRYSNTVQGAITMNVDGSGAKPIYINGGASSSSNHTLPAGTYIAFYDGTNWYFDTNGGIPFQMGGGDTWNSVSAVSSDTPEDIILREIAAIANRPNGHYANATSWTDHANGYSINIIKVTYGANSGTMYNGTLILNGGDDENSVSYPFVSNGTWVHLGKNKTVSATGICQAVSTSLAYMFVPVDIGNTNYTITVTSVGSIVNIGAPSSITIQTKYTNGFIININRTGLTTGNSYFLSGAVITLAYT